MSKLVFTLNAKPVECEVEDRTLLVELLREHLGQTGTHVGCDTSQCGCCTVMVEGDSVKSCTMLARQVANCEVVTVEGLGAPGELHPIQEAFIQCHGLQCGFCTPGMIMTTACLLAHNANPSEQEIIHALEGNLCRCTGYVNIVKSVQRAAQALGQSGSPA
jgi:aerobic carbon-monoxide dehydrogenase small subunit